MEGIPVKFNALSMLFNQHTVYKPGATNFRFSQFFLQLHVRLMHVPQSLALAGNSIQFKLRLRLAIDKFILIT